MRESNLFKTNDAHNGLYIVDSKPVVIASANFAANEGESSTGDVSEMHSKTSGTTHNNGERDVEQ